MIPCSLRIKLAEKKLSEIFEVADSGDFANEYKKKYECHFSTCNSSYSNSLAVVCSDCCLSSSASFCLKCFDEKKHKDHNYIILSSASGFCDCGTIDLKEEGYCDRHKAIIGDPDQNEFGDKCDDCLKIFNDVLFFDRMVIEDQEGLKSIIKWTENISSISDGFRRIVVRSLIYSKIIEHCLFSNLCKGVLSEFTYKFSSDPLFCDYASKVTCLNIMNLHHINWKYNDIFLSGSRIAKNVVNYGSFSNGVVELVTDKYLIGDFMIGVLDLVQRASLHKSSYTDGIIKKIFETNIGIEHKDHCEFTILNLMNSLKETIFMVTFEFSLYKMEISIPFKYFLERISSFYLDYQNYDTELFSQGFYSKHIICQIIFTVCFVKQNPRELKSEIKSYVGDSYEKFLLNYAAFLFKHIAEYNGLFYLSSKETWTEAMFNVPFFDSPIATVIAYRIVAGIIDDHNTLIRSVVTMSKGESLQYYYCILVFLTTVLYDYQDKYTNFDLACLEITNVYFKYVKPPVPITFSYNECIPLLIDLAERSDTQEYHLKSEYKSKWSPFVPFNRSVFNVGNINSMLNDNFNGFNISFISKDPTDMQLLRYSNHNILFAVAYCSCVDRVDAVLALSISMINYYINTQLHSDTVLYASSLVELLDASKDLSPSNFIHTKVVYNGGKPMSIADFLIERRGFCNYFIKCFNLDVTESSGKEHDGAKKNRAIKTRLNVLSKYNKMYNDAEKSFLTRSDSSIGMDMEKCCLCRSQFEEGCLYSYYCFRSSVSTSIFADFSKNFIHADICGHSVHERCYKNERTCSICRFNSCCGLPYSDSLEHRQLKTFFPNSGEVVNSIVCTLNLYHSILSNGKAITINQISVLKCFVYILNVHLFDETGEVHVLSHPRYKNLFMFFSQFTRKNKLTSDNYRQHAERFREEIPEDQRTFFDESIEIFGKCYDDIKESRVRIPGISDSNRGNIDTLKKQIENLPDNFLSIYRGIEVDTNDFNSSRIKYLYDIFKERVVKCDELSNEDTFHPFIVLCGKLASMFLIYRDSPAGKALFHMFKNQLYLTKNKCHNFGFRARQPVFLERERISKLCMEYHTLSFLEQNIVAAE